MASTKEIVEQLTIENIISILEEVGAEPKEQGGKIIARTVCHNSAHEGKHKLEFYTDNKLFHCYTECGTLNIFDVVMKSLHMEFKEALNYICKMSGIDNNNLTGFQNGFSKNVDEETENFFNRFKTKERAVVEPFKVLNENILYYYYPFYHYTWIKDGIEIPTMRKFGIKYDIENNRIIIPHRDIEGSLIGVRARNLNEIDILEGRKYMPIYHKGKDLLNHATGNNLYGIFENKEDINNVKTIILMESEKGVMQLDSFNMPYGVAISGSTLSIEQIDLIKQLNVTEVILALDKEFNTIGDELENIYANKVKKSFIDKLKLYFKLSIVWDTQDLLDYKDSPTDKGKEVFEKLLKERVFI